MPAPVAVVLVTGSFALPEFYDAVTSAVNAHDGVEMTVPHLPSVGLKTGPRPGVPPPTMHDDAAHVAGEIARLADAGQDVIVVSHSYGGFPATESIRGLEKAARLRQGREAGGVVRLAYMTALVGREGVAAADVPHEVPKEHKGKISVDDGGWLFYTDLAHSAKFIFSDLPQEEGERWMQRFPTHSSVSFQGTLTYAGYKYVPVSYLVAEGDKIISPTAQRKIIQMIEKESGQTVDIATTKAGHCPPASAPQEVTDWILGLTRLER